MRLLHIVFLRRARFGREPHPFILWWICHIDLYALLSGAGTGQFVRAIMDHQMLPSPDSLLYPIVPEGYSMIYLNEHDSLPVLMRLYAGTFHLAAQLGFLAAELRQEKQSQPLSDFDPRFKVISNLRRAFAKLWESSKVSYWYQHQDSLPRRSQEVLQQVSPLTYVLVSFTNTDLIAVDYPFPCLPAVLL